MAETKIEDREVLFALEGERKPRSVSLPAEATFAHLLEAVRVQTGRVELEEVLIEDEDDVVELHHVVIERIVIDEFKLVHIATRGKIAVTVTFNGRSHDKEFGPNATMDKIVRWAMKVFALEGDASDFQLKLGEELLPAGEHLGQVAEGKKKVRLSLVMKIKPQG